MEVGKWDDVVEQRADRVDQVEKYLAGVIFVQFPRRSN